MNERLTDNEFHSKDKKERACYIQEPRLQAIYDKCFEYEDIDTNPTRLANIKKALEIIKSKKWLVDIILGYCAGCDSVNKTATYGLLKEVLYEKENTKEMQKKSI